MSRMLLALVLVLGVAAAGPAPSPLHVKASPAVAPCVAAAALEYERLTGRKLAVETVVLEMPESAGGADVVVAADRELNRIIESGTSHPGLDVDVAKIPWVLCGPVGSGAVEAQSLARTTGLVLTLDGVVGPQAAASSTGTSRSQKRRLTGRRSGRRRERPRCPSRR